MKGNDKEAIEAAATKLTEASGALAQKMYAEQANQAGGAGAEQKQTESAADDGVVEAEFEEVKDNK